MKQQHNLRTRGEAPAETEKLPEFQPVVQSILTSRERSAENRESARSAVLNWASSTGRWSGGWRENIPADAYQGAPFDTAGEGSQLRVTTDRANRFWAFEVEHDDTRFEDQKWRLEAFVEDRGDRDVLGVRVLCRPRQGGYPPSSTPALVRAYVQKHSLVDGGAPVMSTPIIVEDELNFNNLLDLLLSKERALPVIVVSEKSARRDCDGDYLVDTVALARTVQGLAHVVKLPAEQSLWLTDDLGKELSVFRGAMRTYLPGFHAHSNPREHPLFLGDKPSSSRQPFDQVVARRMRAFSVSGNKLSAWPKPAEQVTGPRFGIVGSLRHAWNRMTGS